MSSVSRATVPTLKPKNLKKTENLNLFSKNLRFVPALVLCQELISRQTGENIELANEAMRWSKNVNVATRSMMI